MNISTSERVICFTGHKVNPGLSDEETNRCIYVLGKMWLFTDEEIWSILSQRGELEKILLKFDPQSGYQKGFAFAVYSSYGEVEHVLEQGQVIDLGNSHLWLEKGQRNSSLVVYSIDRKISIDKMAEEACQYGKIVQLETALIKGGKTLFIEYKRRVDAESAKSGLSRRFTGEGGSKICVLWADSKILNNFLSVKFSKEDNNRSGNVVNQTSLIQTFSEYGDVKRVEFIRDNWNNFFGEVFVYYNNTASGQISALWFMEYSPMKTIQIDNIKCNVEHRKLLEDNRYCSINRYENANIEQISKEILESKNMIWTNKEIHEKEIGQNNKWQLNHSLQQDKQIVQSKQNQNSQSQIVQQRKQQLQIQPITQLLSSSFPSNPSMQLINEQQISPLINPDKLLKQKTSNLISQQMPNKNSKIPPNIQQQQFNSNSSFNYVPPTQSNILVSSQSNSSPQFNNSMQLQASNPLIQTKPSQLSNILNTSNTQETSQFNNNYPSSKKNRNKKQISYKQFLLQQQKQLEQQSTQPILNIPQIPHISSTIRVNILEPINVDELNRKKLMVKVIPKQYESQISNQNKKDYSETKTSSSQIINSSSLINDSKLQQPNQSQIINVPSSSSSSSFSLEDSQFIHSTNLFNFSHQNEPNDILLEDINYLTKQSRYQSINNQYANVPPFPTKIQPIRSEIQQLKLNTISSTDTNQSPIINSIPHLSIVSLPQYPSLSHNKHPQLPPPPPFQSDYKLINEKNIKNIEKQLDIKQDHNKIENDTKTFINKTQQETSEFTKYKQDQILPSSLINIINDNNASYGLSNLTQISDHKSINNNNNLNSQQMNISKLYDENDSNKFINLYNQNQTINSVYHQTNIQQQIKQIQNKENEQLIQFEQPEPIINSYSNIINNNNCYNNDIDINKNIHLNDFQSPSPISFIQSDQLINPHLQQQQVYQEQQFINSQQQQFQQKDEELNKEVNIDLIKKRILKAPDNWNTNEVLQQKIKPNSKQIQQSHKYPNQSLLNSKSQFNQDMLQSSNDSFDPSINSYLNQNAQFQSSSDTIDGNNKCPQIHSINQIPQYDEIQQILMRDNNNNY